MCHLLGGGTQGCCQCGCHYSATTASNDSANNSNGYTSDPGATTPCDPEINIIPTIIPPTPEEMEEERKKAEKELGGS
jgi:hypothetical protein